MTPVSPPRGVRLHVHLVLVVVQLLFVTLAIAGRHVLGVFLLAGEELTRRAALAAAAIFSGVGMVLWAEHRQRREVPVEALGE